MTGPHWELDEEQGIVTVTFPTDPPVALRLDAALVDEMIRNLGAYRARMEPEPSEDWKRGAEFEGITDPCWFAAPARLTGGSLLHVRDPRYGWLHYALPPESARKLGVLLITQADATPSEPKQGKPN